MQAGLKLATVRAMQFVFYDVGDVVHGQTTKDVDEADLCRRNIRLDDLPQIEY